MVTSTIMVPVAAAAGPREASLRKPWFSGEVWCPVLDGIDANYCSLKSAFALPPVHGADVARA
jgi:hypothetical protein